MFKGTIVLVLACIAAVSCATIPEGNRYCPGSVDGSKPAAVAEGANPDNVIIWC